MQKLRKKAGLLASDALDVYIGSSSTSDTDQASSSNSSSNASNSRERRATPSADVAAAAPDISRVLESQVRGAACCLSYC